MSETHPKGARIFAHIVLWSAFIGLVWWLGTVGDGQDTDSGTTATSATQFYIAQDAVGCRDWETHEKLTRLAVDQDAAALRSLLSNSLALGRCRKFTAGEQVYRADSSFTSLKVRPAGALEEYWLPREAVTVR